MPLAATVAVPFVPPVTARTGAEPASLVRTETPLDVAVLTGTLPTSTGAYVSAAAAGRTPTAMVTRASDTPTELVMR